MDQKLIENQLFGLGIDKIEYFKQITSTNDAASQWLNSGAQGRYFAVADEQIMGRGRDGRKWETPPNSALAFSLAFSREHMPIENFALVNGYVSVAICKTLEKHFNLEVKIKWPNDILLNGQKLSGILTEAKWQANQLQHLIIGIGINVASSSIEQSSQFQYPATYLNAWLAKPLPRSDLIGKFVASIFKGFEQENNRNLLKQWESRLAYRNEKVELLRANKNKMIAILIGLDSNGRIRLRDENGQEIKFSAGEIRMRPIEGHENN